MLFQHAQEKKKTRKPERVAEASNHPKRSRTPTPCYILKQSNSVIRERQQAKYRSYESRKHARDNTSPFGTFQVRIVKRRVLARNFPHTLSGKRRRAMATCRMCHYQFDALRSRGQQPQSTRLRLSSLGSCCRRRGLRYHGWRLSHGILFRFGYIHERCCSGRRRWRCFSDFCFRDSLLRRCR